MAALVELHEEERHHEADGRPLETPEKRFKHPNITLTKEAYSSSRRLLISVSCTPALGFRTPAIRTRFRDSRKMPFTAPSQ